MKKHIFIFCAVCLLALSAFAGVMAANTITADSGFRVAKDGFSFENYGSEFCPGNSYTGCFKVQNLTAEEMVRMYGTQVCKSVDSDGTCTLTKAAQSWMKEINSVVANGHCEGMAVLSSLFYNGTEDPADFGNSNVNRLTLKNNTALQREIAYWFTTQWFMDDYIIEDTPTKQVNYLIDHFKNGKGPIPLGIYQRNMSGGHAITAYAVVDHGSGIYYIMVYDNNYPNEERYITVDTKKDTWSYQTSVNTWTNTADYSGKGKTNPLQICPLEPRLGTFECDFCTGSSSSSSAYPYSPSDGGSSIWDILSPFINPSDSGSEVSYPTAVPDSSSSSSSIWDILSPFISPYDSGSEVSYPTAVPDSSSSSSSIWDILSPFISPYDSGSSSEDDYVFPTQRPYSPTSTPQPLVRPTAIPETNVENNKISVSSDINIYLEDEAGRKAGYDWENDTSYEEIPGVTVSRTMGRASAELPNGLEYYAWMNKPSNNTGKAETFDAVITAPGRVLKLTNIVESYIYPNFIYEPPTYNQTTDSELEFFEVLAYPDEMPGVDFTISDDYGEYNFAFTVTYKVNGKRASSSDAFADFIIYHNYDEGDLGIAILPAEDSELSLFRKSTFSIEGSFSLWDDQGELHVAFEQPLEMDINGMIFFNYLDWQENGKLELEADLDGDDEFEKTLTL